ncbi:5'-nucleotidase [Palleronia aestuarii]|uniref:5'-nucleotidase n=1 Tax=Palleronia aestuarii TaxID=568105 RepID=A0A2W7NPR6_9RHOB|nr:bifunctional metallophosphatase/5'-nucleotidase [Palleronia aestuarii]PZX15236.1 5'-nucleotidase [Palleronia aestuarii]
MISRLASSAAFLALTAGGAAADYQITILHTNDFHARFEPITSSDGSCAPEDNEAGECFGGSARLVTAIRDAIERHENTLLVDAGDQFQGSLFYTYYKGALAAEMMNAMGYDAMAVGNHEFDDGPDVLETFTEALEAPLLMANADLTGEEALREGIEKSVILEKNGERIGIIGLTPQNNEELASPGPNIVFTDPSEAVQAEVDRLTGEGVNKIVLLSHSGYQADERIAQATSGVDIIVGGHSHTLLGDMEGAEGPYPTMVNETAIVQAYGYGKYLGELDVTFDDDGKLTEAQGAPILLDASVEEDAATVERISMAAEPLDEIRNEVIGEAAEAVDGDRTVCRARECTMGVLIADAMLDRVADQGIEIALQNGGGIRASIDAGEVTMGEVLTVLPFQNTLSTFEVSGQTLLDALENGASQMEEEGGRFAQVAGMSYTVDPSAKPGSRISDVMVGGQPIETATTYGVVSNNYVRNGGDGYEMFVDAQNAYDFGPDLADVTAEYLSANTPYTPMTDGRITVVGE